MKIKHWLRMFLAGVALAIFAAMPGLPLPGADRLGLSGSVAAQGSIDIDTFYDELEPYGQWVWHPRFGYVWLPEDVSPNWRPYTVGHWVPTEEYGWYWDSHEPFAWAVYHYGRWGYDPDYGWFWVPGDTWAPAWVQWRYSDDYVGWAPIGPRRHGYAYGAPVNYEPPIAESWVFVRPRYMTSRAIPRYAVPIAGLGAVFLGTTNVYRPRFHDGRVYNYGIPRDRVVKITKRPIHVQKIYKVDRKGGRFDKDGRGRGVRIYAPGVAKDGKPRRGPKRFADHPDQFKPKAKLRETFKGEPPKGWGRSAKSVTPIAKEAGPDAFKRKHGRFEGPGEGRGDKDKGQAATEPFKPGGQGRPGKRDQGGPPAPPKDLSVGEPQGQGQGGQGGGRGKRAKGGPGDKGFQQGRRDQGGPPAPPKDLSVGEPQGRGQADQGGKTKTPPPIQKATQQPGPGQDGAPDGRRGGKHGRDKRRAKGFDRPDGGRGGPEGQGAPSQAKAFDGNGGPGGGKHGRRDKRDNKGFGGQGGPGGQGGDRDRGGRQAQGDQGGGGKGGKKDKCQKHPDHPSCRN